MAFVGRGRKTLFAFLKKKAVSGSLVGVSLSETGAAYARVQVYPDTKPVLHQCDFIGQDDLISQADSLGLVTSPLAMVMPMGDFSLQMLEAPQVEAAEMQAAVRWKVKDMLDYELEQAIVDVFEIPGLKEQGRTAQVYAVFTHQDKVRAQVEFAESAAMQLQYVDIPELVQRNIASLLPEDEKGVALLRFNARSGLITLTQASNLYLARSLDTGFESLGGLSSPASIGEVGLSLEAGVDQGMMQILDSIVLEIQRSLDYYESHFGKPPISNLVIAPIEQEIVGLDEHIKNSLGLNVRQLDLNDILQPYEPLTREQQARCFYAIGAALRSVKTGKTK